MGKHSYLVVATSPATPERVFDLLADAPRWREWAGPSIRESAWVSGTTGGIGAVRRLGRRPFYTRETITEFQRPLRMRYSVEGLPVRDYRCTVELTPVGGGTEIRWSGRFTAPRVVAGPLRALLVRTVRQFATAAAAAATSSLHGRR
jgi:uncharacterized protein YndB with AHSA1/START domain